VGTLPSVSLVVVNWNGRQLLETCLPSIAALDYPRECRELIVFDNGSADGSVEWLARRWPEVRVLGSESNLGFAEACNRAAAAGGGEILALVNNDLRVEPSWLTRMVEALRSTGAVAAGSRILDWDGLHYDFDGGTMNFYGHGASRRYGRPYTGDRSSEPTAALFACGAAMIVERERFLETGGFDPEYFAYFEDVDLGWRLWVEGERVVYVPGAVAYHQHHGSRLDADRRTRLLERNALASVMKNYDDANLAAVLPAALLLIEARACAAGDARAPIYRDARSEFLTMLPALRAKRAVVQARRRRADRDVVSLFGEPFRPSCFGRSYWRTQQEVVRAFGIGRMFGEEEAMAVPQGMDEFVAELQGRIEDLERELASARETLTVADAAHGVELVRLNAEIDRLRRELSARAAAVACPPQAPAAITRSLGGLWRLVRGR
jgi:GT2 family glycosyltransferase